MSDNNKKIAVLGAGPAGLMAAWRLCQAGFSVTLFEQESVVGGMCATQTFKGRDGDYRFDYGGHRFITKNPELLAFIDELMGEDLLHAERKSVIRFGGRTYDYPLNLTNLLRTAPLTLMAGAVKDLLLLPFAKKPDDFAKASFASGSRATSAAPSIASSSRVTPASCGASTRTSSPPTGPVSASVSSI